MSSNSIDFLEVTDIYLSPHFLPFSCVSPWHFDTTFYSNTFGDLKTQTKDIIWYVLWLSPYILIFEERDTREKSREKYELADKLERFYSAACHECGMKVVGSSWTRIFCVAHLWQRWRTTFSIWFLLVTTFKWLHHQIITYSQNGFHSALYGLNVLQAKRKGGGSLQDTGDKSPTPPFDLTPTQPYPNTHPNPGGGGGGGTFPEALVDPDLFPDNVELCTYLHSTSNSSMHASASEDLQPIPFLAHQLVWLVFRLSQSSVCNPRGAVPLWTNDNSDTAVAESQKPFLFFFFFWGGGGGMKSRLTH